MAKQKRGGPRRYVSSFSLGVGPFLNFTGSVCTLVRTGAGDAAKFTSVCPTDEGAIKVSQEYTCPNGHGPFKTGDLEKAKEVDGELVRVSKDDIAAAKASGLPENVLSATVHPAEAVLDCTYPVNAYVFVPDQVTDAYTLLLALVMDTTKAIVGMCNLRGNEGFFKLDAWGEHIVLQKLVWPGDTNEFPALDLPPVGEQELAMGQQLLTTLEKPFDPTEYQSGVRASLEAMTASLSPGPAVPAAEAAAVRTTEPDLLATLRASLEASQA